METFKWEQWQPLPPPWCHIGGPATSEVTNAMDDDDNDDNNDDEDEADDDNDDGDDKDDDDNDDEDDDDTQSKYIVA